MRSHAEAVARLTGKPERKPKRKAMRAAAFKLVPLRITCSKLELPLRLEAELNEHEHWRARQRRAKHQHAVTAPAFTSWCRGEYGGGIRGWGALPIGDGPLTFRLTRLAPRSLDEGDNLNSSGKFVRDAIAAVLGMKDDGRSGLQFVYAQEKSPAYGVRIEVL